MYGVDKETIYESLDENFKSNINNQVKIKCKENIVGEYLLKQIKSSTHLM